MLVFLEVVFPVLLVFAVGFVLQKTIKVDPRGISTLVVYVFLPCLVFKTLYATDFTIQYVHGLIIMLLMLTILIIIVKIYVKIRKTPAKMESGLILATGFMNAGNYGSPILLFAYGTVAFEYGVTFFVISSILLNSVGLYYAARGVMDFRQAFKTVFKLPAIYAVFAVAFFRLTPIPAPENIVSIISFVGDAAIPCVMVILGMQLAQIKVKNLQWEYLGVATVIRLFLAPLIAFGLTTLMQVDPLLQKVLILIAALPTASQATIYAVQFDAEPEFVSGTTLVTTVISLVSVAALISIMG